MKVMLATLAAIGIAAPAQAAELDVRLDNVSDAGGTLYVSVQTREQFMQETGTAGKIVEAPAAGAHSFSFEVPPGDYAVSVWHDDNGNGSFDMGDNDMPADGWAMVNGEQLRAEPRFDQIKTTVTEAGAEAALTMIYPPESE